MSTYKLFFLPFALLLLVGQSPLVGRPPEKHLARITRIPPRELRFWAIEAERVRDYRQARICWSTLAKCYPGESGAENAYFFLGLACYRDGDFAAASEAFGQYLRKSVQPEYYDAAVYNKLLAARQLGLSRRLASQELAAEIYEEVASLSGDESIAITALLERAEVLFRMTDYEACVAAYQNFIYQFPEDENILLCFLNIQIAYLHQAYWERNNPDVLPMAEANYEHFSKEYPNADELISAKRVLDATVETYARRMLWMAGFYERKGDLEAAKLYYRCTSALYPDSRACLSAKRRL